MSKRICFFTTYFYPEDFKGNDIAFEFSKRGYKVTVITAIPNYPAGKYYTGYSLFKKRREIIDGVKVIRLPVIPRGNGSGLRLILNYLSYIVSSVLFTVFFSFRNIFDAVFVQQLSPFFVGIPAVILSKRQKIPLYFWVLDLWPESVRSAGNISNQFILHFLNNLVIGIYEKCTKILIGSRGFEKSISQKGDFSKKLIYFPNWAEEINESQETVDITNVFPFSHCTEEDFVLLFAGNLGEAQNLGAWIETANITRDNPHIKWVFLGDGRYRTALQEKVAAYELGGSFFFPGRFPLDTMPTFMKKADILLVSLKDTPIFNLTIPQKIQFYMAQGKPILAMLNGDGAKLISEAQCGYSIPAGDYTKCAEIVRRIFQHRDELLLLGENGKAYYENNFKKADRMNQLDDLINNRIG